MTKQITQPNRRLQWVKMPTWWATNPEIHEAIANAPTGDAIAALKLYLGMCATANRTATEPLPLAGSVAATLTEWSQFLAGC